MHKSLPYRMKRERFFHVAASAAVILAAGTAYYFFYRFTGIGIPCIFRTITGFMCPGCGVTHMFAALFALDIRAAFEANPVILLLLPVFTALLVKNIVQYIWHGQYRIGRMEQLLLICSIAALLVFGVWRNL